MHLSQSLIQWPTAKYWTKAWNPIIGCRPISPACDNCYARAIVRRFSPRASDPYKPQSPDFLMPHRTSRSHCPTTGVVFCGNMTDLFGSWVGDERTMASFIRQTMKYPDATYLYLTKRPENMANALCTHEIFNKVPGNHYFGVTGENQVEFDKRMIHADMNFPLMTRVWVSVEPMLGPVRLVNLGTMPEWVVVGCESGPNRRRCWIEWVRDLVRDCRYYGIPVFVKQLDIDGRCVTDINQFPEDLRIRQVPWEVKRV